MRKDVMQFPQSKKTGSAASIGSAAGFTLVEIMVAMVVFGVLATGMTTLMACLIQNNEFSQDMTEATKG